MDNLYLEIYNCDMDCICKQVEIPLETLIIYFVYKQLETTTFKLNFIQRQKSKSELSFTISINTQFNIISKESVPLLTTHCIIPLAICNNVIVVSGLCSVARQIIKGAPLDDNVRKLLGFREACLMACNEASVWTKFCEIDMVKSLKQFLQYPENIFVGNKMHIPEDFTRFECHLSQPVRIHNVYKVAHDQAKLNNKSSADLNTIPKEKLELKHLYGEGPYMTLADVILFPMVHILHTAIGNNIVQNQLPLTYEWYENMVNQINQIELLLPIDLVSFTVGIEEIIQENIKKQSLYISDLNRYKPKNRIFTKQQDIIRAINAVKKLELNMDVGNKPYGFEINFDWSEIPLEANPEGGALPKSRMKRKCEQLENLVKAVMKIAKPNQVIIDFCSGSGHLGILLAVKLPKCQIILLENKENSLNRAKKRIEKLKINNVILLQCNLDYFLGDFDIGVSLHACGVATDLVIRHCLQRNAAFVNCPCCYGGVHVCHHISYPRSKIFQNSELSLRDYLVLGHSADQTHDALNVKTKQGIQCMNIIDTDRKLQAEELGYEVLLAKMIPESCTPKNNILVGLPKIS